MSSGKEYNYKHQRKYNLTHHADLYSGLSEREYNWMLKKQDSRCAICKTKAKDLNRRLAVDHCHELGAIRGLLCINCNLGLGLFRDDLRCLANALVYLEDFEEKVRLLGSERIEEIKKDYKRKNNKGTRKTEK